MNAIALAAALSVAAFAGAALADDGPITTSRAGDPPTAQAPEGRCPVRVDKRPHGEVWGSVGTGGYREVGGVVTQPIGDCATVTIGMSRTEGRFARPRF